MRKLLIIEPNMNGHHGVYLRSIVRGATERNWRVFIATFENSLDHPMFKTMFDECKEAPEIITLPLPEIDYIQKSGLLGLFRREMHYHKLLKKFYDKTLQNNIVDFVLVPFLDYCIYALALFGSPFGCTPWAGITMRPSFHYEEMGIIGPRSRLLLPKKLLFFRMLQEKNLRAIFTIDPPLYDYLSNSALSCREKVYYLRDPGDLEGDISKETARQLLQIPKDAVVILVYGTIDYRKNVDILLSAAVDPEFHSDVHILLAGRQVPEVLRFLRLPSACKIKSSGRLHEMNKFLNEEEEFMVFKASDIAWLGYRGHYNMSGMLSKAGYMGLPVIACKEGLIGWLTQKYRLGITVSLGDMKSINAAILHLKQDRLFAQSCGKNGQQVFIDHAEHNFVSQIFGVFSNS